MDDVADTGRIERKLTTIFAADVKDYSRLMEHDEVGTLDTLRAFRAAMERFIERHRGRVVGTAGDSVLAEFPSVVEAVTAAGEIQSELAARNAALEPDLRMEFRIGINLGDVMVDGGDIFGEGVNIAARLQTLAEPGGICISGSVHEQVRNKLTFSYDFLGEREVKNISRPIPVYRVELGTEPGDVVFARPASRTGNDALLETTHEMEGLAERTSRRAGSGDIRRRAVRRVARLGVIAAFFFLVDAFSGPDWWFHWPTLAIALVVGLASARLVSPGSDRAARRLRLIWRLGIVAVFFFLVDLWSGPGWWFYWPILVIGGIAAFVVVGRDGESADPGSR